MNNGGIKPGFPSLPSIPPEEKILIKGQTRNGRAVSDFRQTIPGKSTPRDTVSFSTLSSVGSPSASRPRTQVTLAQIGRQSSAPAFSAPNSKLSLSNSSATILVSNNGSNSSNSSSKVRPHSLAVERRYSVSEKDKFYAKSNSVANFRNVSATYSSQGQGVPLHHGHHYYHHDPVHHHHLQQYPLQYPHVVGNSRPVIGGRIPPVKSSSLILDKVEYSGGAAAGPHGGRFPSTLPNNSILNNNLKNTSGSNRTNNNNNRRPVKLRDSQSVKLMSATKEMLIPSSAPPPLRAHHSLDRNVYRNSYRSPAEMQAKIHKTGRVGSGHASDTGMVIVSAQKAIRRRSLAAVEVEGLIKV